MSAWSNRPVVIAVLMSALLFGGLLHAVIPHDDGVVDDHGGGNTEAIIWGSLHSAIQHEDKKTFAAFALFELVAALSLVAIFFVRFEPIIVQDQAFLRKSSARYRRFG